MLGLGYLVFEGIHAVLDILDTGLDSFDAAAHRPVLLMFLVTAFAGVTPRDFGLCTPDLRTLNPVFGALNLGAISADAPTAFNRCPHIYRNQS